jgi:2-polyprenyl-3-methyl-5-hydroxy-6-metoxy-1,4-benzoquinol methylase
MPERIKHACPVCDSLDSELFCSPWVEENDPERLYGAASGIPGAQFLVKCKSCDMIYESPRYDSETIIKGYMSSQEAEHDSQYPMRVKSFYLALKKHSSRIPPHGAKILDIGTAGGAFLEAATQFGYKAFGMEPSSDLVERGRARGLNIEQGTIESHSFELGSFDMVCLWDVIEHLPDPKAALLEVKKLLKPDGILLINYPDIGTLQAKLAGKRFWWILSVHLHHFTRKSIFEICRRTGFDAFHFQRYWQVLEFGYLERMAVHYKIPLTKLLTNLTPKFIQSIPIPYYASQTTVLARITK